METIIAALIGAGISLVTTVATLYVNSLMERNKLKTEIQQKDFEAKRERLTEPYMKLISIINAYPRESPNDLMKNIEYPPNYSMEHFDAIIKVLGYQIEDYQERLKCENLTSDNKLHYETEMYNREYLTKQILGVRDAYFNAHDRYNEFRKSDKAVIDLYAGQEVKNSLVEFEVLIHNVFLSGHSVGDIYDSKCNRIEIARRKVVDCMRNDIGL